MLPASPASSLLASVLLAVITLGAAQIQGDLEDSPADCVEYTISKNPYHSVTKSFYSQLRLGLNVHDSDSWVVKLKVEAPRAEQSCTFTLTSRQTSKRRRNGDPFQETFSEVSGSCSSWPSNNSTSSIQQPTTTVHSTSNNTWSPPLPPLRAPVSFVAVYGWSIMDVVLTEDSELVLMSTSRPEVESLVLPSSGLYGQLQAEWVTDERHLTVRYDCYSECTLRSGVAYHSTLGDQFYLWRSKDYDSLEYTAFPSTNKNIFQVVEGEPLVAGLANWVTVLTDTTHKTFNWTIPGSPLWRYLPWTVGHLHAYDDIQNNMLIHVPESSLVTNCHPYQLPCPDDPFHCQAAELERGGGGFVARLFHSWEATLEWGVLIIMLIIIVLLIFLVCTLKRRLRMYDLDVHQDEVEASPSKNLRPGRRPSAISKGKMSQFCRHSEFVDDFESEHFYEDPTELRNLEGNNYSNTPARGGAARGGARDSELYCNMKGRGASANMKK